MVSVQRSVLASALWQQIKTQELYERNVLRYTRDSSGLASLREVLEGLKRGEFLYIIGDIE